jgi:inosine/xanthosine triphosphate pyrophosphatase family protein
MIKKSESQKALDALAVSQQAQMRNAAYQSHQAKQANYAQQAQIMAGGGASGAALGAATSALGYNPYATTTTTTYAGMHDNERRGIEHRAMLRERMATIKLIEEMAEEVGAPNLLHAIVLAITSREYPTEE